MIRTYRTSALRVSYADSAYSASRATDLVGVCSTMGYSQSGQGVSYAGTGGPQVMGQGGGAAMISFHRPGAYAINFGLDTDNQLSVGGWSYGAARKVIIDSGNIGSQSVNAATYANKLTPISGPASYRLAYTADSQRTNAGEWGRVVMLYDGNGQTYGVRTDRADYADSAGNADTVDGYHASSLLSGFNAASSFGTHGYQKFGNGLIIQWGQATVTTSGGAVTATFPVAFPNSCLQVVRAEKFVLSYNYSGAIQSWNNSGVTANNWSLGTWHYIAIGY